jgi:uncharacterized protein (DUF885 family)
MRFLSFHLWVALILGLLCLLPAAAQTSSSLQSRRKALNDLLAEQWEYRLRTSPMYASFLGDKRWNDQLDDFSQEAVERNQREARKFLARFEAIDSTGFPEPDALNKELMVRDLKLDVEGSKYKLWEMPMNQQDGPQVELPGMPDELSFESVKDYEDYISRLKQVPRLIEQNVEQMRKGIRDKLMPPRFLLEKVAEQCHSLATQRAADSPFAKPFANFPKGIAEADQKRLREDGLAAIRDSVLPAFVRLTAFVRNDYAPKGRSEPGVWSLPGGGAIYHYDIRRMTTTDMTAEQIHQLGLKQVDETEKDMLALAQKLGFKDLASLNEHIKNDRTFYGTSGEQMLDLYAKYVGEMEPELPKMFGRLPKSKLQVIPMEASRSKNAVPADYSEGTADGTRAGHINVNEWDPEHRLVLNVEAIAYHEGIPGHHLQISIAQELPDLPPFRRYEGYTAFVEGWALYAERLGKDLGKYQDPYSDYGRLENEMWRAIRLVIDTGVHEKRWTREQMVDYFHRYTAMDEPNVESEVDRYIAWPGQALAYKLGQLEILRLRQYAKDELGDEFDMRAFHDEVIGGGALPLDVLDKRVHEWVVGKKVGGVHSASGGN